MKPAIRTIVFVAVTIAMAFARAAAMPQDGDALVRRMADANPSLESYTATLHVAIVMHSLPFLSPSLDGNYYYKRPDKQAVVFQSVPLLAQQFQKVYPKLDPPSIWLDRYDIAVLGEADGATTLRLVPKHQGRVAHLDVVVNEQNALPSAYTWTYNDGGSVSFRQQYVVVDGNYLVKSQSGHIDLPSYNADVTSTFSDFKLNVPIPDSVF
ncbi:MAG: LolA family protein [Vulcanimicrobiaceae bacterium]